MPPSSKRARTCAIYTRVSTESQTTRNQLRQLKTFAKSKGWTVVAEYADAESGSAAAKRRQFQQMLEDADARRFNIVLWWSLDRFTREGAAATFAYLQRLRSAGVDFVDFSNPLVSSLGVEGELFIAVSAIWARLERERIVSRTKAGLDRARAQGKKLGRPKRLIDREKLQALHQAGLSPGAIAKKLKVGRTTVRRRLAIA